MSDDFEKQIECLIEKHIPVAFLDYKLLQRIKEVLFQRDYIGRKEMLIIAYLIGVTAEESDVLLCMLGHPTLYAKKREDAIWRFALNHRLDSMSIFNEIFPKNVDEIENQT